MDGKKGPEPGVTEATAAPARARNAGDGGAVAGPPLRFSAKRRLAVAQRLPRGERLEKVSRETNVPVHRSSDWRAARDRRLPVPAEGPDAGAGFRPAHLAEILDDPPLESGAFRHQVPGNES